MSPAYKDRIVQSDAFTITGGHVLLSRRVRDVMLQFDLGATELFAVSIYRHRVRRPPEFAPRFLFHVTERAEAFDPERSTGVEQVGSKWPGGPPEGAPWLGVANQDKLAVRGADLPPVDMWADVKLMNRIFFSDRLKTALSAREPKSRILKFHKVAVVD